MLSSLSQRNRKCLKMFILSVRSLEITLTVPLSIILCEYPCMYLWISCMYLWISLYLFLNIPVCISGYPCIYLWICVYVFVDIPVYICEYPCMYLWISLYTFVDMCVCICGYPCIYLWISLYIFVDILECICGCPYIYLWISLYKFANIPVCICGYPCMYLWIFLYAFGQLVFLVPGMKLQPWKGENDDNTKPHFLLFFQNHNVKTTHINETRVGPKQFTKKIFVLDLATIVSLFIVSLKKTFANSLKLTNFHFCKQSFNKLFFISSVISGITLPSQNSVMRRVSLFFYKSDLQISATKTRIKQ